MTRRGRNRKHRVASKPRHQGEQDVIVEHSAGGIVFKRTEEGLKIGFIKDPYGKWTFAKGHLEEGETVEEAAVRETKEEMGLRSLRILGPLGRIELFFEDRFRPETKGKMIRKYVDYFLMQAAPGAFGRPERSRKICAMTWVPLDGAMEKSPYTDVHPLVERAVRRLTRMQKVERERQAAREVSERIQGKGHGKQWRKL